MKAQTNFLPGKNKTLAIHGMCYHHEQSNYHHLLTIPLRGPGQCFIKAFRNALTREEPASLKVPEVVMQKTKVEAGIELPDFKGNNGTSG